MNTKGNYGSSKEYRRQYTNNSLSQITQKRRKAKSAKLLSEIKILSFTLMIAVLFITLIHFSSEKVEAERNYTKKIVSVEIQEGDTLWSYAEQYADSGHYASKQEYINEVIELNGLHSTNIHTGKTIALPMIHVPSK